MSQLDPANEPTQPPALPGSGELDYLDLDAETRAMVQRCTIEIKALTKRTSVDAIEIGEKVLKVKQKLKRGKFCKWLEKEFDWSDFSARQFMNVAKCFKTEKFSDLKIEPSALYLLARPSTDQEARQEALQRARKGEKITHRKARKIIDDHINPPIVPEVLLPEQKNASAQKQARPSLIINVDPSTTPSIRPEKPDANLEAELSMDSASLCFPTTSEKIIEVHSASKILKPGSAKSVFPNWNREVASEPLPDTFPPLRLLSLEVDAAVLQRNPLQVVKLSGEGVTVRFEARAGDLVSWLQEHSLLAC